jgi:hypothetical protein
MSFGEYLKQIDIYSNEEDQYYQIAVKLRQINGLKQLLLLLVQNCNKYGI